jgi:predicted nucleic acid-binding protein
MTEAASFSLDANVLIYAYSAGEPAKARRALELIERAMAAECVVSLQTFSEFYHASTRKKLLPPRVARQQVEDWIASFRTTSTNAASVLAALKHHQEANLSYWDALLLATLREAGCAVLLSEDMQHGTDYDGVTVLNPFLGQELASEITALLPSD